MTATPASRLSNELVAIGSPLRSWPLSRTVASAQPARDTLVLEKRSLPEHNRWVEEQLQLRITQRRFGCGLAGECLGWSFRITDFALCAETSFCWIEAPVTACLLSL
jgi:hypothetical protein